MTNNLLIEPMLDDYGPGHNPGWPNVGEGHPIYVNPKFGQLEVGPVPGETYDQWLFHEINGGGPLVIGYAYLDSGLHVMMLKGNRRNLVGDQDDWEASGGFSEDGEPSLAAAARELLEEAGMLANVKPLPGRHFIGNRAFFKLLSEDEGSTAYMFKLSLEQIVVIGASEKLKLMPWRDAVRVTRDALTGMALARFLAEML